jgi:hypothetical protein
LNPRAREIAKELTNSARKAAKKHTSAADVRNDDVFSPVVVATAEKVGAISMFRTYEPVCSCHKYRTINCMSRCNAWACFTSVT